MVQSQVASDFDAISPMYDETRDPLEVETVTGLVASMRRGGVSSVLEVGVGTGRVAQPVAQSGLSVTGVDLSKGMLAQARRKGLERLVRASGFSLPFRSKVFDAALFVHVLHVVDDAGAALREASRVSRNGVWALVHPRGPADDRETARGPDEAQQILREVLSEQGFEIAPRRGGPGAREREILAAFPPDSWEVVSEEDVTESIGARLDRLAKGGNRQLRNVPPEALRHAIEVARARAGDRVVTQHRVEALAHWASVS